MKIKILDYGAYKLPTRAHENDAGADVYSPVSCIIQPGCVVKIPLGFGLVLPDGMMGLIYPRSSLSARGIVCELPPIDSGYRGEVHAIISNVSSDAYNIYVGDRVGQLVVSPIVVPEFIVSDISERGLDAFGSTGR